MKRTWSSGILAMVFLLMACGQSGSGGAIGAGTGKLAFKVMDALGPTHDVAAIHFAVVAAGQPCTATPIQEATEDLLPFALPDAQLPPTMGSPGSVHPFADALFILPAGAYTVCAQPVKSDGTPSADCMAVSGPATVVAESTVEIALLSQCTGDPLGGLDVIGALNTPPYVTDLGLDPGKFFGQCGMVTATVTAEDPDGDEVTYTWSIEPAFPLVATGNMAKIGPGAPGDYEVKVVVKDPSGAGSSLSFPLHVVASDAGCPDPCQPPLTQCCSGCVDLTTDAANCGACGHVCPEMKVCVAGECVCAPDQPSLRSCAQ